MTKQSGSYVILSDSEGSQFTNKRDSSPSVQNDNYKIATPVDGRARNDDKDHLALVALATVADLVPLTGANRTLLKFGLEALKKTTRPGLLALFDEAQIERENLDVYAIGHVIGPRLNAMGRMESAMDSLRLLCTKDNMRARILANKLGVTNRERQVLTKSLGEHAIAAFSNKPLAISEKKKLLFIADDSYEQGIIGLVAGKLVE